MSYTPDYTHDPTDADLAAFLTAAGVYTAQIATFNVGLVAGALERFKRSTGRIPFLAEASTTLYFDPPGVSSQLGYNTWTGGGKTMELFPCFTTITAIEIGVYDGNPGSPVDLAQSVFFKPNNYSTLGVPIEYLEFVYPIYGLQQSVAITGTPGNYAQWPVDAWNGVLMGAAADLAGIISASISGGRSGYKEADYEIRYPDAPMQAMAQAWSMGFERVCKAYKLGTVGVGST